MAKMDVSKMRQSWAWRYAAEQAARWQTGLCYQLNKLLVDGRITRETYRAMFKRIEARAREEMVKSHSYCSNVKGWLLNNWIWHPIHGQIERTAWAMEQARLTRRG